MNKKFTKLIAALALLVFIAPPLVGWGQTRENMELTFSLTSNPGGWPTANSTTLTNYTYTLNEVDYTFALMNVKCNSGYLMLTSTAVLGLPAIANYKLAKVEASNSSGCSTSTKVGISSSSTTGEYISGGEIQTWSYTSSTYTYTLTSTVANTMYYMYVTNKNAQVTSLKLTYESTSGGSSTTYTVTYNGNGNTSGSAPVDSGSPYDSGATVTVLGNTGSLAKEHYTFGGWNTAANGSGTNYAADDTFSISANTTLYAKWIANTYTITLPATDTYGTYTMNATNPVAYGTPVALTYTPASGYESYVATWNVNGTPIDGNTFTMPDEAVTVTVSLEVDYATLPFTFNSGKSAIASTVGLTESGLGSDYASAPKLKFDNTDDYLILKVNERIGNLGFDIKNNSFSGGTFKVQTSVNGSNYTDLKTYTSIEDTQNESIDNVPENARYIKWIYTSKSSGNVGLGNISVSRYVVKYAITVTQPAAGGTIAADKSEAEAGATITLTPSPATHYNFTSWSVYKTGEPATTVSVTDSHFTMPAYPVTVTATFTAMTVHTISIPTEISSNVTSEDEAYAGDEVTITVDAPTNEFLTALTVTGSTSGDPISISPAVSSSVDVYTFTMPDEDVTITASFGSNYTLQFSVNGTIDGTLEETVTAGNSIDLPSATAPTGYTFAGWTANEASTATILTGSYTPSANVTLYAVYEKQESVTTSMTIDKDTENFPTSYGNANTFTEYELNGKKFKIQQVYVNSGKLQFRASGNSSGTGIIYNNENFGTISSIVLNYNSSDTKKNFTIVAGSTANPTSGTGITPTIDGSKYTFDLSGGSYSYFVLTNGENAGYLDNIVINYSGNVTVHYTLIKDITSTETMSDIYGTYLVTVKNNGVLTLTGSNSGTIDNLIIEDGGQLVTDDVVEGTIKKTISAYDPSLTGQGVSNGWNFISYPLNTNGTSGDAPTEDWISNMITTGSTYDLYELNENTWINYKAHTDDFTLSNGHGYLYANASTVTLEFAGSLNFRDPENDFVSLDNTGWNLVGNPFAYNTYPSMSYYKINAAGTGIDATEYTTADAVPPCTGILVNSDAGLITFSKTAPGEHSIGNHGNIQMTLAQQATNRGNATTLDNAIVSFNECSQLGKFYFGTQNANLYIPQGNEEYAIVSSEGQGEMPVNFRANENGTYTLTVNAENVEMNYLHLIDNMTGADTDLLQTPSYTFDANTKDYESRFRLVFSAANGNEDDNEAPFAYFNGSEWMVYANANATLQVVDMMGRVIVSQSATNHISTNGMAQGVYVLRLLNGETVRTQKIVVR